MRLYGFFPRKLDGKPWAAPEEGVPITVEAAGGAEIDILDAGLLAQAGPLGGGLEPLLPAQRRLGLVQDALRRPFGVTAVGAGHVGGIGAVAVAGGLSGMGGDPAAAVEDLTAPCPASPVRGR